MDNPAEKAARSLVETLRSVLGQVAEPGAVLRTILEQAVERTGAQRGLFVEVSTGGELSFQVLHGFQPSQLDGEAGKFSRSLFTRVLANGQPVLLASMLDDPYYQGLESVKALQASSVLCAPIRAGKDVAALLYLEHRQPGAFRREHVVTLESLGEVAGPVLEAMRAGSEALRERDQLRQSESRYRSEAEEARRQFATDWSFGRFIGRSAAVRRLEESVRKAAGTSYPVLVTGETGTGKSMLARILHYTGPRAKGPLVTVFCPALEKSMVESELFGHRKGAFTGADSDRIGKVQAAEGGTLFLDEIGDLTLDVQAKLLRLLHEKKYERLGDPKELSADVRVIAATNRDLEADVRERRFRQDLFERLNFIPLEVPPLREHAEDIPLLLRHCLDQSDEGRWVEISPEGEQALVSLDFAWPGNVRHIEQLAARLASEGRRGSFGPGEVLDLLRVRSSRGGMAAGGESSEPNFDRGLPGLLEDSEKHWLQQALLRFPDQTRAQQADKLKISESLLYKLIRKYGLG